MQMWPRGASGGANVAQNLAFAHALPGRDRQPRQMGISGRKVRAMVNFNQEPVVSGPVSQTDYPLSGGGNRRAGSARYVYASMHAGIPVNGMYSPAIAAAQRCTLRGHT
jgi:hypothetical protein